MRHFKESSFYERMNLLKTEFIYVYKVGNELAEIQGENGVEEIQDVEMDEESLRHHVYVMGTGHNSFKQ